MQKIAFLLITSSLLLIITLQSIVRSCQEVHKWKARRIVLPEQLTVIFTSINKSYVGPLVNSHSAYMKKYVNKHANTRFKMFIHKDGEISPYWTRVFDLKELSDIYPDNTLFVYLDVDAVVKPENFDISMTEFVHSIDPLKKKDIYISEDPLAEYPFFYGGIYNTGVFIVRNTIKSRKFINDWLKDYDRDLWSFKDNKWSCKINNSSCFWSADGYEQYAFSKLSKENKIIMRLHHKVLAGDENSRGFVTHMMGASDKHRISVIEKFNLTV